MTPDILPGFGVLALTGLVSPTEALAGFSNAGARTGFAAIVFGIIVGITLLFLTPLINAVADKPQLKVAILDIEAVEQIDTTGEEMLAHMSEWFKEAGIEVFITRPNFKVTDVLKRTGLYDKIGEEHIYSKRHDAIAAIKQKYGDLVDIEHLQRHIAVDTPEK